MTPNEINVLWVENDQTIEASTQMVAEGYNISLTRFGNWMEAKCELLMNYDKYQAIILDALCSYSSKDAERSSFLIEVVKELYEIFGKEGGGKKPWYVLSAGTMDGFDKVVELINSHDREECDAQWGPLVRKKDKKYDSGQNKGRTDADLLFEDIVRACSTSEEGRAYTAYKEVFDAIDYLFCNDENKSSYVGYMLGYLTKRLYPEKMAGTKFSHEIVEERKMLDAILKKLGQKGWCNNHSLINGLKANMTDSIELLCGRAKIEKNGKDGTLQKYEVPEGRMVPYEVGQRLPNMLAVCNHFAHVPFTEEEMELQRNNNIANAQRYLDDLGERRAFENFAELLCDVMVSLAAYLKRNPNPWAEPLGKCCDNDGGGGGGKDDLSELRRQCSADFANSKPQQARPTKTGKATGKNNLTPNWRLKRF